MSYLKLLDQAKFKGYEYQYSKDGFFGPLSDINIFVGGNNAGKSRFLRELFAQNDDLIIQGISADLFLNIESKLDELASLFERGHIRFNINLAYQIAIGDPEEDFFRLLKRKNQLSWDINSIDLRAKKIQLRDLLESKLDNNLIINFFDELYIQLKLVNECWIKNGLSFASVKNVSFNRNAATQKAISSFLDYFTILRSANIEIRQPSKIYIPNLRSVVSLFDEKGMRYEKDIFSSSLRVNYGFQEDERKKIFTGLSFYSEILNTKGSYNKDRKQFKEFEKFLSKAFFNNQGLEITAISADKDDSEKVITITFDKSQERAIHLLGDGIHNLIMLVFQFFICNDETKIYIEEPETNLHPGLERVFVELLLENEFIKRKKLQIFFTTHSTHIINLDTFESPNTSIFYFQKKINDQKEEFLIRNVVNPEIDILSGLGVKNSSLFMSNVSIWVEGITDRNYIKGMLEAYYDSSEFVKSRKKKYLEDLNFGFFEYAGSNISHYIFNSESEILKETGGRRRLSKIKAQFLANRIFLIADKDKGKDAKHSSLGSFVSDNFKYYRTPGREIENLISEDIFRKVLPKIIKDVKVTDLDNIDYKKYKDEYIGAYFRRVLRNKIPSAFKAKSGTISTYYKTRLSEVVYQDIIWEDMHTSMKRLTKQIYEFIEKHNSDNSF